MWCVCGVKCVECVFVHGNSGVGGLTTVVVYDGKNCCGSFMVLIWSRDLGVEPRAAPRPDPDAWVLMR